MSSSLAPGVRVEIRDAEWVIRKVELTGRGQALHVTGLSDPVKDKDAISLSDIENLRVLKPEETRLVSDDSPGYRSSLLYLESLLRQTPPTDERIYIGHRGGHGPCPISARSCGPSAEADTAAHPDCRCCRLGENPRGRNPYF